MTKEKNKLFACFSKELLLWYKKNARDLPWRKTKDPYKILLSEILLQQTRVSQGLPYYEKFILEFPSVRNLAEASEQKVLKLWQGLGYYSRARNLRETAKKIVAVYGAEGFPKSFKELIELKGVGRYTASAVASIAFNEVKAVVDGNVYRVLSRVFGVKTPIDGTEGVKTFQQLADELIDKKKPGDYNQALMEFGALVCTPKNPSCNSCIFLHNCCAYKKNEVNLLPIKIKKLKKRVRHFYYFDVVIKDRRLVKKRENKKDVWFGLYEFPCIETKKPVNKKEGIIHLFTEKYQGVQNLKLNIGSIKNFKHLLTHQTINATFVKINLASLPVIYENNFLHLNTRDILSLPLPKLFEKYLNSE